MGPFIQSRKRMSLKFSGELCVMTMSNDSKSEEELTCQFKSEMRNLTNFDLSTQNIKNLHFNRLLLTKVYNIWAEQVQRSYVWWHSRLMQSWRKTDLCFEKWHEEFDKFSPEHLKVSKLELWWHRFVQSWKCMSLRFPGEFCVMTMKNDAKTKEELTC